MDLIVGFSLASYFHCISYTITIWVEIIHMYNNCINFVTAKQVLNDNMNSGSEQDTYVQTHISTKYLTG